MIIYECLECDASVRAGDPQFEEELCEVCYEVKESEENE